MSVTCNNEKSYKILSISQSDTIIRYALEHTWIQLVETDIMKHSVNIFCLRLLFALWRWHETNCGQKWSYRMKHISASILDHILGVRNRTYSHFDSKCGTLPSQSVPVLQSTVNSSPSLLKNMNVLIVKTPDIMNCVVFSIRIVKTLWRSESSKPYYEFSKIPNQSRSKKIVIMCALMEHFSTAKKQLIMI